MEVIAENTVSGILFLNNYKRHWSTKFEELGKYITQIDISYVSFENDLQKNFFDIPTDVKILVNNYNSYLK